MSNLNEVFFLLNNEMKEQCKLFDNLPIKALQKLRLIQKGDDKFIYNTDNNTHRVRVCCNNLNINFGNFKTREEARKYRNAIIDYIYFVNL